MDKIVGDKELIEKLQGGAKHVEVFDSNGNELKVTVKLPTGTV